MPLANSRTASDDSESAPSDQSDAALVVVLETRKFSQQCHE